MTAQTTALHDRHAALGARLVPFAGWSMPVQYPTGPLQEHRAVRTGCGLFDVSHMGNVVLRGAGAAAALDELTTWPMSRLKPGRAKYTVFLNDQGGTVDDLIVYRRGDDDYLVIWNAGNHEKNLAWTAPVLARHGVELSDRTADTALIALQGPDWRRVFEAACPGMAPPDKRFGFVQLGDDPAATVVARTGYTGEDGVEIWLPNDRAGALWDALVAAGGTPCGLAARDSLRTEAGLPLYGHELSDDLDPVAAGVGFVLKDDERNYHGRGALEARLAAPERRGIVGFVLEEKGVPRQGYTVHSSDGIEIGVVTSGTFSPMGDRGVGLALVRDPQTRYDGDSQAGHVQIRGRAVEIRFARPPLHLAT